MRATEYTTKERVRIGRPDARSIRPITVDGDTVGNVARNGKLWLAVMRSGQRFTADTLGRIRDRVAEGMGPEPDVDAGPSAVPRGRGPLDWLALERRLRQILGSVEGPQDAARAVVEIGHAVAAHTGRGTGLRPELGTHLVSDTYAKSVEAAEWGRVEALQTRRWVRG